MIVSQVEFGGKKIQFLQTAQSVVELLDAVWLLSGVGVKIELGPMEPLEPCFDESELRERNRITIRRLFIPRRRRLSCS